jgi:hypothetical protein
MSLYRVYIDEVGNHDMEHADDPNQRFLGLTGVIVESQEMLHIIRPEMEQLKARFFQTDPDEPVIFHRKEMVNRRWPFKTLLDPEIEKQFNATLLECLRRWNFQVVTVVIDKLTHRERYVTWLYHPYHYCLKILLERYILFLDHGNHRGDVMVESRGGKEDHKLKKSYTRLYYEGTDYVSAQKWQARLTSKELKVKPKKANIQGLQLADIIAHPSNREILRENRFIDDPRHIFGDLICEILGKDKYLRNRRNGQIEGYGKKLLP